MKCLWQHVYVGIREQEQSRCRKFYIGVCVCVCLCVCQGGSELSRNGFPAQKRLIHTLCSWIVLLDWSVTTVTLDGLDPALSQQSCFPSAPWLGLKIVETSDGRAAGAALTQKHRNRRPCLNTPVQTGSRVQRACKNLPHVNAII